MVQTLNGQPSTDKVMLVSETWTVPASPGRWRIIASKPSWRARRFPGVVQKPSGMTHQNSRTIPSLIAA